eukprot:gene12866-15111_t
MIRNNLEGVEFVVCNTDRQDLHKSLARNIVQLGPKLTRGHGAGARPDIGRMAAEESITDILSRLRNSNLVFVAAGMGGGTGTGSAPVIARELKRINSDALIVAVVTRPFRFEGRVKERNANAGLEELSKHVDTMVVVSNDRLLEMSSPTTTMVESFGYADEVLHNSVRSITNMINFPGLVNIDYNDIRNILTNRKKGFSRIGVGVASGEDRALRAAIDACNNPLIEHDGQVVKGVLVNISGGTDVSLKEIGRAMTYLQEHLHEDAEIIIGHCYDSNLNGVIRISILFVQ